jgi:hypothetical protein
MRYILSLIILVGSCVPVEAGIGVVKAVVAKRRETHEGHLEKHRHKKVMRACNGPNCP